MAALGDTTDLIAEVGARAGPALDPARAWVFLQLAEARLARVLRLRRQEHSSVTESDSGGQASLPMRWRSMISVAVSGVFLDALASPSELAERSGYIIVPRGRFDDPGERGNAFVLRSTHARTSHTIHCFTDAPQLSETGTSWLLTDFPDLYIYAMLCEVHRAAGEAEPAAMAEAMLGQIVAGANQAAQVARASGRRIARAMDAP